MDYNADKYLVEDSDLLTEAEKIEMARSLRQLELEGVIEWRDGAWQLAANVETEEPSQSPVEHSRNKEKGPGPNLPSKDRRSFRKRT